MGFFSWNTKDTKRSIANSYSSEPVFTVFMHDNKGNRWQENEYEGYGVFGGKDYYELLSEMNGGKPDRNEGINIAFDENRKGTLYPQLTESPKPPDDFTEECEHCEYQGYFYGDMPF